MNCSDWRRLGCFVLVQVAAISGCQRVQDAPGSAPAIHLIIPEDYRGPIEFNDETGDPLPEPVNGERRIEIDEHGRSDIDAVQGIAEQPLRVSLSSGETVKHCNLRPEEVGFRSAVIFREHQESFDVTNFLGTESEFQDHLTYAYNDWWELEAKNPHRVESGHPDEYLRIDIKEEDLEGTPVWDGASKPSVTLAQAIAIASEAALAEKFDSFPHHRPILKHTALVGLGKHHYWRISFEYHFLGGSGGRTPMLDVIVLMNGRMSPGKFVKLYYY